MTAVTPPGPIALDHWSGRSVAAWRSRGSGVLYLADVRDNLVLTSGQQAAWPLPKATLKKLTDAARASWFDPIAWDALRRDAKSASRLQSINSEDAVTWSTFGTLLDADEQTRASFLNGLLDLAGVPASRPNETCQVELWKRYAHPDTGKLAHGPEADAILIGDQSVVCIEAKWLANEGGSQGTNKDKTQLEMRLQTVQGIVRGDERSAMVLGIVPTGHPLLDPASGWHGDSQETKVRVLSWEDVAQLDHPEKMEIGSQLAWRRQFVPGAA